MAGSRVSQRCALLSAHSTTWTLGEPVVGAVAGLVGFGGAGGGVVFGLVAGYLLDAGYGYGPVFAAVSSFHVLAFGLLLLTIPRVETLT
jgi:MFS transporter, ACS family, hexuronate transporter